MLIAPPKPIGSVAIVGAGISGLACARELAAAGRQVALFDKSRGLGGRSSTRRASTKQGARTSFDHGAQYFTVRDQGFAELVARWRDAGKVQPWHPRLWRIDGGGGGGGGGSLRSPGAQPVEDDVERLVAVPGMSTLGHALLAEIDPRTLTHHPRTRITEVRREKFDWELFDEDGRRHSGFSMVVLALPAGQIPPLLGTGVPSLAGPASACRFDPCWTVMISPTRPLGLDFDAAFVSGSPLAWIANNASKPGRPDTPAWVLQASGAWTRDNLERDRAEVGEDLLAAFRALVDRRVEAEITGVHHWRYAKPDPLPEPFLLHAPGSGIGALGIGACGDWCGGPRVEGAFVSGRSLARAILARGADPTQ
ncbi:FAD-dependent oxidoreductase [Pseudenhygromyxa sp. WMMC2535]|uniref:NAD(P)/FAD-dependent oxidoreductase n=1 Tax=Pseudenhygromyxa sp. WMMC2535 TaxID=2712867 RepID=UPI001557F894|nr:FAD-dependent oxidoreductase [Pseudenhygromyxa sp. WMMC2535]NVB41683.1 FAD-dependent oxidoreductase [Pseudenhygromyxa sp. WMMC2535]